MTMPLPLPLTGLTVLDFTRVYSGPYATLMLSDLGATVIKVEHPNGGDDSRSFGPFIGGSSGYFETLNRGKQSICVEYKQVEGQQLLRELARTVDVVIENFRPGQMARLGLDYARLRALNPGLVYVSISGFGQQSAVTAGNSVDVSRGCYDIVAQAESGLMSLTGLPHQPLKTGPALGDAITGLTAAVGLLAALWAKERYGRGAYLDIAMVDAVFACLENALSEYDVTHRVPQRQANADIALAPFDGFEANDGWIVIGVGNDMLWRRLAVLIDPHLADDARFATNALRVAHYDALRPILVGWCAVQSADALLTCLHQTGIPAGRVRDMQALACDPRLESRRMLAALNLADGNRVVVPGCPIQIEGVSPTIYRRAPQLGEHTQAVLGSRLGYIVSQGLPD